MAASSAPAAGQGPSQAQPASAAETGVAKAEMLLGGGDLDEEIAEGLDVMEADDEEGEEEVFASATVDSGIDAAFEEQIQMLEAIMMDEAFNEKVDEFMKQHCSEFEEGEENKLSYMTLFSEYTKMLEGYIEEQLGVDAPDFDMRAFCTSLSEHADKISLDTDTLGAFGDFETFKEMMLSCKRGQAVEQGGGGLCLTATPLVVHTEEQEDGEEMADLNLSITAASISPAKKS